MGGCLARLFGGRSSQYKKVEDPRDSLDDVEGGRTPGGDMDDDDDEDWEDFGPPPPTSGGAGAAPPPGGGGGVSQGMMAPEPEPEEEEEVDPFAGMGMAPSITKTKRHAAPSPFAKPAPVQNTRLTSMLASMDEDASAAGGWGEDGGDDLDFGNADRRKANEERREQNRRKREERGGGARPTGGQIGRSRLGATKGGWE